MAQAGSIQTISGPATATTPQGQVRELHVGDIVYENEFIETSNGAQISIVLNDGNIVRLTQNSEVLLDASVGGPIDKYDAIVHDVEALQNALLNNEDIDEEKLDTAIGEEESGYYYDDAYHHGDASKGQVGSYLLDSENDAAAQTFDPPIVNDITFENVDFSTADVSTTLSDSIDTTTVSLAVDQTAIDEDGATLSYTVTLDNPTDTAMVVTLSNGETVTIAIGAGSGTGSVDVVVPPTRTLPGSRPAIDATVSAPPAAISRM